MNRRHWITLMAASALVAMPAAHAGDETLIRLLEKRSCARCNLADEDF